MANNSRLRRRELVIGATVLLIATLAYIFGWTNLFVVREISVTGAPNKTINTQILKIADIQRGEKLARIEARNISANLALAGLDWIESVQVSRNWLTRKVIIQLNARAPIATAGDRLVDSAGVLFSSPITTSADLVTIDALNSGARAAAVELLLALPKDFLKELAKITVGNQSEFTLTMKNRLEISWGANSDLALKMKIYRALLALPENKNIKAMDLSDPTKPSVK